MVSRPPKEIQMADHRLLKTLTNKYARWRDEKLEDGRENRLPNLTFVQFENIQTAPNCMFCGCKLNHLHMHPQQLTMERINPKRCYEWGNVVPTCRSCNDAKAKFDHFFHSKTIPWKTKKLILNWARNFEDAI